MDAFVAVGREGMRCACTKLLFRTGAQLPFEKLFGSFLPAPYLKCLGVFSKFPD